MDLHTDNVMDLLIMIRTYTLIAIDNDKDLYTYSDMDLHTDNVMDLLIMIRTYTLIAIWTYTLIMVRTY